MHEYSVASALVARAEREARARHGQAVLRLAVTVGELSGVDPALLASAYEVVRAGTLCAGAALDIAPVPTHWACANCGRAIPRGEPLTCPACARPARLVGGDELRLEHIEVEVERCVAPADVTNET